MFDLHPVNCTYHKMSDDSFIDTAAKTPEKDSNSVSAFFDIFIYERTTTHTAYHRMFDFFAFNTPKENLQMSRFRIFQYQQNDRIELALISAAKWTVNNYHRHFCAIKLILDCHGYRK